MNIVLDDCAQLKYHTDMNAIFDSLNGAAENLNWLVTDFECNYLPDERLEHEYLWISGKELSKILRDHDGLQFIWGVFSGFPPEYKVDLVNFEELPYAEGNASIHNPDRKPQHSSAVIEIVAWDSAETIFTTDCEKWINSFSNRFTYTCGCS